MTGIFKASCSVFLLPIPFLFAHPLLLCSSSYFSSHFPFTLCFSSRKNLLWRLQLFGFIGEKEEEGNHANPSSTFSPPLLPIPERGELLVPYKSSGRAPDFMVIFILYTILISSYILYFWTFYNFIGYMIKTIWKTLNFNHLWKQIILPVILQNYLIWGV